MIPPLRKISSREKRHQSKQNPSTPAKGFTRALEDACEKEQQRDIHIHTTGYTRDARPFYHLVSMREYC